MPVGFRYSTVNPIKLETGLRPNGAGIPYTLLLRIEAVGFPTLGFYCKEQMSGALVDIPETRSPKP